MKFQSWRLLWSSATTTDRLFLMWSIYFYLMNGLFTRVISRLGACLPVVSHFARSVIDAF